MLNTQTSKSKIATLIAILMTTTAVTPLLSFTPASARPYRVSNINRHSIAQWLVIPAGTKINVSHDDAQKILVTRDETLPLTLRVASNVTNGNGTVLIPQGSEIVGQIQPSNGGARFVAQQLVINGRQSINLNATSQVVTTTETIRKGASTQDILMGTLAGAGAATIIAGVTGDQRIDALEVLAGAAVGTLAGWGLPTAGVLGGSSQELIAIDPNRDLTLTVQTPVNL